VQTQVLIVGAGPTGLVLALWLTRLGVPFRIIEKNSGPGQASRAMAVQARTLEFYQQMGFATEVIDRGIKMEKLHLHAGGRVVAKLDFGHLGPGISPFPFALSFPQDEHEQLLITHLTAAGVKIDWNTELTQFTDDGQRITATLATPLGEEKCEAAWLCGCDGARSSVRNILNLGFSGGTYDQVFFVADVDATGDAAGKCINIFLTDNDFCIIFPIRTSGMIRLIGIVPQDLASREDLAFEDVQPYVTKLTALQIRKVNWFSKYHVHHRVADHFHKGRVFIAGDAGHIHSPVGGQGMNTGIGDAVNLAWKLAAVVQGRADSSILATYETERIAFAHALVATTDQLFQGIVSKGFMARLFRVLVPQYIAPIALRFRAVRRAQFRIVSQTRIRYRHSALSIGDAGRVHGGDRLPWLEQANNFAPLKSLDWQIHVYGTATRELQDAAGKLGLPLHSFAWNEQANGAGLHRDALYLVRPDGYVALADKSQHVGKLKKFLERLQISPRNMTPVAG
jgi:2-polyprenyl-6-methoxyphenol hydroxylase-like FAD-dependent oxidoreductase